jgi:hypothetical protein
MPPAERPTTGYLTHALARGARPFHFRTGVRTLLTGVSSAASWHGAQQPFPGFTYVSPAPAFDLRGNMESPASAALTVPAAARAPASPHTGSSIGVPPRATQTARADEQGARPPSGAHQTAAAALHGKHQQFGADVKTESRPEIQAVSSAPQWIAIPESRRAAPGDLASATTPKVAPFSPRAPSTADRAHQHDPTTKVNPHPADLGNNPNPVEHVAKLPDAVVIGPQPNLASSPVVPPPALHMAPRARADLASETPGRSPSPRPTPAHVPWPNTRTALFDRAESSQHTPQPQAPRPERARITSSAPMPTRAPLDPTQQRALRTLEQLRHSVQALVSKPPAAQPPAPAPVVPPPTPPPAKVVLVRPAADRVRRVAAFWERRYLGHPQLRVFR